MPHLRFFIQSSSGISVHEISGNFRTKKIGGSPNFPKFWAKILPGQPKKICRRVRTLALEAIGLGSIPASSAPCAPVSGGCLAMSLGGYVVGLPCMWLAVLIVWLARMPMWLAGCCVALVVWLAGWLGVWLPM